MKKIILIQLLAFFAISLAFAGTSKNKFQQGYVVTNQLDTLWGSIVLKVEKVNAVQCQFKANQSDSVTTYLPYEIKSYRLLENGNLYVSEQITLKGEQQKSVFLEFLQQGEVELYLYVNAADNKEYFFVRRQGDKLILLEQNITSFEYSNRYDNRYIGQLTYLLSDAPSLKNDIDKTRLSSKSLKTLLSKYEMLKSDSSPIVFASSKKNKIVTDFSVSTGATYITAQLARKGADFMVTPKYSINLRIGYSKSYGIYSRENMQMCQVLLGFGF